MIIIVIITCIVLVGIYSKILASIFVVCYPAFADNLGRLVFWSLVLCIIWVVGGWYIVAGVVALYLSWKAGAV